MDARSARGALTSGTVPLRPLPPLHREHRIVPSNQNVMQLSAWQRTIARLFLGAKTFIRASWAEAQSLLEQAVAIEPNRIVHRLDLGHVYADRKQHDKARRSVVIGSMRAARSAAVAIVNGTRVRPTASSPSQQRSYQDAADVASSSISRHGIGVVVRPKTVLSSLVPTTVFAQPTE